jgi:hypothetical protein
MLRPLYPRGKSLLYPLHRRLGGPQSRYELFGVDINLLSLPGIEPRSSSPHAISIPTELSQTYGECRCSSNILDLGTKWRWVTSFTHLPLYPRRKPLPPEPLDRAPEPIWMLWGRQKSASIPEIEHRPSSPWPVAVPICAQKRPSAPERVLTPQARGPHTVKIKCAIFLWSHFTLLPLFPSLQPRHGPGFDSASSRNEYQESSWK